MRKTGEKMEGEEREEEKVAEKGGYEDREEEGWS